MEKCVSVVWPKTLEWLAFSDIGFRQDRIPEIAFLNNGTMKYLDVSNNIFETFPKPIYCRKNPDVYSTIEFVDASNCGIKCLNKTVCSTIVNGPVRFLSM